MDNKYYVYSHSDPRTGKIVYYGKGQGRRAYTISPAVRCGDHAIWIRELKEQGLKPLVSFIKNNLLETEAYSLELMLINTAIQEGVFLVNGRTTSGACREKYEVKDYGIKKNELVYNKIRAMLGEATDQYSVAKLSEVRPLNYFDEEVSSILLAFYNDEKPEIKRFGTILNSVYVQSNNVFLITRDVSNFLTGSDPNHSYKSCEGAMHKKMMATAIQNRWITVLRAPVAHSLGVSGRAGIYEVSHKNLLDPLIRMVGKEACNAKRDSILKWYDDTNHLNKEPEVLTPEIIEERRKAREIADEIFNRK